MDPRSRFAIPFLINSQIDLKTSSQAAPHIELQFPLTHKAVFPYTLQVKKQYFIIDG